jgi:hypothetical protein
MQKPEIDCPFFIVKGTAKIHVQHNQFFVDINSFSGGVYFQGTLHVNQENQPSFVSYYFKTWPIILN